MHREGAEVCGLFFILLDVFFNQMCAEGFSRSFLPLQRRTQQQEQLSIRYKEMVKCQTLPNGGEQVPLAS